MSLRLFFARFREKAGAKMDSVERVLLEQLIVTHLKITDMHALAASAKKVEHMQIFSSAAAKLIACLCQLTTTLSSHRASRRESDLEPEFKSRKNKKSETKT